MAISSPGGSVFAALDIIEAIHEYPGQVDTLCTSLCASAAAVVFESGHVRAMRPGSVLMIHSASISDISGHTNDLQNALNALEAINKGMINIIAQGSGLNPKDILAHITGNSEWWIDANEAVSGHLADLML